MDTLEKDLKDCIKELQKKFENSEELKAFEKVNTEFESLVKQGLIKKKGNTLLTTAELHLKLKVSFNTRMKIAANTSTYFSRFLKISKFIYFKLLSCWITRIFAFQFLSIRCDYKRSITALSREYTSSGNSHKHYKKKATVFKRNLWKL